MGLFKKRSTDPDELDRLRTEIAAMAARLDEADAHKTQLDHRVHHIATRLDQPPPAPPEPAVPPVDPADVDILRARIQRLNDRLDQATALAERPTVAPETVRVLEARLDHLSDQLATTLSVEPPPAPVGVADLAALAARIDALQARLDAVPPVPPPPPAPVAPAQPAIDPAELAAVRDRIERLDARIAAVDSRITSISTELANQLTEISGEIDALASRPTEPPAAGAPVVDPSAVDLEMLDELAEELRDTQIRLANEQARYQIAFRQELADLAERLRRH